MRNDQEAEANATENTPLRADDELEEAAPDGDAAPDAAPLDAASAPAPAPAKSPSPPPEPAAGTTKSPSPPPELVPARGSSPPGATALDVVPPGHVRTEAEYISRTDFEHMMGIIRLRNSIPISVLVSLGTGLICGLVMKPGMGEVSTLHPTLLTPNNTLVGIYWAVLYALQIGFCLLLLLARKDSTKDLLIKGVGMRFAIANWIMAGWHICWTFQLFRTSEILIIINVVILLSIHFTLRPFPQSWMHPIDAILVHHMTSLFLAVLLDLHFLHGGSVALDWVIEHRKELNKYTWQTVGALIGVNVVQLAWEAWSRSYALAVGAEYLLISLLISAPRINPSLPESAMQKPAPVIIVIIIFLILHPIAAAASVILHRENERDGRVHMQTEVAEAEQRALLAEERARRAEGHGGGERESYGTMGV